jgi:hypothetical protein
VLPGRNSRPRTGCVGSQIAICTAVLALSWTSATPGAAQDVSKREMQGLDEQVQEIKSDVLSIAAELNRLEERLLFPSNTQVAIFVSLAEGQTFRLDSVVIRIDGELVAQHIYSFKELEALKKGGVQRIHTGNVSTGAHRIEVSVAGKQPGGKDVAATEGFDFKKGAEPKLVGITVAAAESGAASIQLGDW